MQYKINNENSNLYFKFVKLESKLYIYIFLINNFK